MSALKARIGPGFGRRELRETAGVFLDGLLSGVERKTGWLMAEQAGLDHPARMQALLGRSRWEADALRDQVRADVLEALGDPHGVLVVDETGFVKKGTHSIGVARQYSGTAGRIENAQVGVFLAYASRFGQALIDRRLYLPEAWAGDGERRARAGVPAEIAFATKPAIACNLVAAALDAGASCALCWQTRSRAPTRSCAGCWRSGTSPTCWPCVPTTICAFWTVGRSSRPTRPRWPTSSRPRHGRRMPLGKAPRACASTTGPGSRCPGRGRTGSSASS
ncbi:IS701 family transposase [uncultured Enterovirga sp.]|uniref:IS701 family transposase n=1 Tax=uncultured Enterovirga sp. TaxID=2026352 RepID=UPI0035CB3A56